MKRRNRMLLKLSVFLLLGAIVNVAVAGVCATLSKAGNTQFRGTSVDEVAWFYDIGWPPAQRNLAKPKDFEIAEDRSFGCLRVTYLRGITHEERRFIGGECAKIDSRAYQPFASFFFTRGLPFAVRHHAGWPLTSLSTDRWQSIEDISSQLQQHRTAGINADSSSPRNAVQVTREVLAPPLPNVALGIHWNGFSVNTIFYAAILWLVFVAPGTIRRFIRVRGHRCPACGFIIAPNTCANGLCSECGARLPESMMRKQAT